MESIWSYTKRNSSKLRSMFLSLISLIALTESLRISKRNSLWIHLILLTNFLFLMDKEVCLHHFARSDVGEEHNAEVDLDVVPADIAVAELLVLGDLLGRGGLRLLGLARPRAESGEGVLEALFALEALPALDERVDLEIK